MSNFHIFALSTTTIYTARRHGNRPSTVHRLDTIPRKHTS